MPRGSEPLNALSAKLSDVSSANWKSDGTVPLKALSPKFAETRYDSLDRPDGSEPLNELELRSRVLYQGDGSNTSARNTISHTHTPVVHDVGKHRASQGTPLTSKTTALGRRQATSLRQHQTHTSMSTG